MGQSKSGTSTTSPSPSGVAALNAVLPQVQEFLSPTTNPYTPVIQHIAQQNPEQQAAAANYNTAFGAANTGLGTYGEAQSLAEGAAQPLSQAQIDQFFNPYVNQVVDAAQRQFTLQNAQQQNQVVGNETSQGALGGNRTAVAGALTAGQQAAAEDPIIAGMLQAGYTQQEAMAAQQYQQVPLAAASALQQIGAGQEGAAGNIANLGLGQYGLGTQQQQFYTPGTPTTATLNALYAEQLAKYGYPIQLTNMAAGDLSGLAGAYGSNTTTTPPPPSLVSGLAGLGTLGIGARMMYSDRRLKEDTKVIGKTKDGQIIYRFRFKGSPQWHIGLMAQDVEKKHPEAVKRIGGYKAIDVKKATDAAARFAGGRVQGLQIGGVPAMPYGASPMSGLGPIPYAGGGSYIPQGAAVNIPKPLAAAPMTIPQDDSSNMFMNALKMSEMGSDKSGPLTNTSLGDTVGDTMQDFRMDTLGMSEAAGGRVPRAYGGLAMPSSNRINVPMRGGFGMPSFMSRGGLAEGGTPDDDIAAAALDAAPEQAASPPPIVVPQPGRIETGPAPSTETLPAEITAGASKPKGLNAVQQKVWNEAVRQSVPPNLALGVLHAESADGRNPSTSSAGALGPMQLMPGTARGLGVNPYNEDDNIRGGVMYLKQMRDQFGSDGLAAAAYNAGPGRVNQYQSGVPLPAETQNYVPKVLGFAGNPSGAPEGLSTATTGAGGIPSVTPIKASDISGKAKPDKTDIALSLMAAGLGMMGSRSPYAGVGIGQGGLQGIGTYEALHKQRVGEAEHQAQLEQQAAITNLHAGLQAAAQRETHEYHGAEIQHQKDVLSKTIVPGTAQDENGNLVPGAYQWDENQKKMVFRPGMMVGKQSDNAKNAEQQAWTRDFYSKYKRLPSGDEIAAHQRELKNASGLDTGIVNETENYPDLKGKAGTLNIDKANQVKVKSAFQSSSHLENIAKYTTEHPGAIGLLAKASNQLNLDAYKGIFDGGVAATKGTADMEKAIDAVASGNVDDVAAAKVLNKMLITQAFNDASASGQRGGVYLDKVFRDLYQQASSPKAFFGILGSRYEDANNTLKPYGLGFDKRSDKENFPFWERLHGQGTETSSVAPPAAIEHLKANPKLRDAFDAKYGKGAAAKALGE